MPYATGETPRIGDHVVHTSGKPGKITNVALNQGNLRGEDSVRVQWDDGSVGISMALASEFRFSSEPTDKETAHFQSFCPTCEEERPTGADRDFLKAALQNNETITVISVVCGHTWTIAYHERANLHKTLKQGLI
jgi:hypothetical protein